MPCMLLTNVFAWGKHYYFNEYVMYSNMTYYFKLTNKYLISFSVLISNKLNIKRYLLHKQNLLGVLRAF